jgi:hypothetical protein
MLIFLLFILHSLLCFVPFTTVLRETCNRTVPMRMTNNELKRVEYSTKRRKNV